MVNAHTYRRRADSLRRFNVGRVLVLHNSPATSGVNRAYSAEMPAYTEPTPQGRTLIHVSAQRKRIPWDRGCS